MASTSTITSLGVGSGLDAEGIVTKLVALERQPITLLQAAADKIQAKISAFGQIQSKVSALGDAARKLARPDIWSATTSKSADSDAVSFTTSTGAATGSYSVGVSSLAASQSVVTKTSLASPTSTLGAGTLTFDVGSWSGNVFTPGSASSVNVSVAATDTLEDIRDKINSSGAGVKASIITDTSGSRLVMSSATSGAANGFRVTATDTGDGNNVDNAGLSSLAYNPAASTAGTTLTQSGANAVATINGVSVSSATNTFSDVLTGISFTVGKLTATDAPINVTVSQDNDTIKKAITDFATAYSDLSTLLKDDTKYDADTQTAGVLQGDGTAVSVLNQFRAALTSNVGGAGLYATLSSIGLAVQSNNTLAVDDTKLTTALANLGDVKKLFSYADLSSDANDGIATKLRTLADDMTGFEGSLTTRTAGLNQAIKDNQKQQDTLDARAALYEKRIRAQYTALDTTMASLNTQSNYVTQMINSWNRG
jgi:flagellar hook-associated protein 2